MSDRLQMTFAERAEVSQSAVGRRLYELMSRKESNLCVALDEADPERFLNLAASIGPEIAVLKTHIDTIDGFTAKLTVELGALAMEHDFLIFEDRKFTDIGTIVCNQYTKGAFNIIEWAHIVNAHGISGPGVIDGLRSQVDEYGMMDQRGLLLMARMSTKDNLFTPEYTQKILDMAENAPDYVMGFVAAGDKLAEIAPKVAPQYIIVTPGVRMSETGDHFDQTYDTPEHRVAQGADLIVVGRDIHQQPKPLAQARKYREAAWKALQQRIAQPKVRKTK